MVIDNMIFFKKNFLRNRWTIHYFFGVKKRSYMGQIISRIYDHYCRGARNLFLEYKLFYSREFSTYKEFLSNKYNLFDRESNELASVFLFCKDLHELEDYNLEDVCKEDDISMILKRFLGGNTYED